MTHTKYMIIGLLAILLLTGCTQTPITGQITAETQETIRIAHLPVTHGLPTYMAVERGWFAEAGIDVELIKFDSPNQIINALLQGQVDFGTATANGIVGIVETKNPGKIKIIGVSGGTIEIPSQNFVVPLESNLQTIEDLRGKRIGILGGTIQWITIIRELLAQHGLDMEKDVTIVEIAPALQVPALASNQVDVLLALEPISTIAIEKGVGKIMIPGPAEQHIANPFFAGADVVRTEFAQENPQTTKKVIEIIERGVTEIEQDFSSSKQYLVGHTPLTSDIIAKVPSIYWRTVNQLTLDETQSVQEFYDMFLTHGVVDEQINFGDMTYSESSN